MKLLKRNKEETNNKSIEAIAELLKIFGDSTRCKIISRLFIEPKKVSDLSKELDISILGQ